jgi:hypothetical protein
MTYRIECAGNFSDFISANQVDSFLNYLRSLDLVGSKVTIWAGELLGDCFSGKIVQQGSLTR